MKMISGVWAVLGLMGLAMASGCGGGGTGPGANDAYQRDAQGGQSSNCSEKIITEYQTMMNYTPTAEGLQDLKTKVQAFKAKYVGVQCVAEVDGKKQTVDISAEMDKLITQIDQAIAAANGAGNGGGLGNGGGFGGGILVDGPTSLTSAPEFRVTN